MTKVKMRPKKIFLVSVDTLRADRLGCYGYGKPTSPNIDRLAEEGVLYKNAFSPCPYTVPTHTSLLTGIYPINHNVGFKLRKGKVDPDSVVFLQEILRGEGYLTGAFVSALVLGKQWGLDWGFDVYDDAMTGTEANRADQFIRDGRETNKAALRWINENCDKNTFVWLHYFDVHGPYTQPPGLADRFRPEDYGEVPIRLEMVRDGLPGGIPEYQLLNVVRGGDGEVLDYQRDSRHYLASYDNSVKYQDIVIGELVDGLKGAGIYEESMIILTADHGEALGEGGVFFFHGLTVTPEQSRIPLIIKFPAGCRKTPAFGSPVSSVDIMPTILDYAGFNHYDSLKLDGVSLAGPDPDRFVLSENEWQRAVIWKNYYLLQEKSAVFDGFYYYFDSQEICRGKALIDYEEGEELAFDPDGPAGRLIKYSEELERVVGPKELRLKEKDRIIREKNAVIMQKDSAMSMKDAAIEFRDNVIKARDEEISSCRSRIAQLEDEIASVYGSKSWRLTYPIRLISARLKGIPHD